MAAKLDSIEMRRRAHPICEHELMLRPVERSHSCIALVPNAEIQEITVDVPTNGGDIVHMTPVHADEVDGPVARHLGSGAQGCGEENLKCLVRHLARGHGE